MSPLLLRLAVLLCAARAAEGSGGDYLTIKGIEYRTALPAAITLYEGEAFTWRSDSNDLTYSGFTLCLNQSDQTPAPTPIPTPSPTPSPVPLSVAPTSSPIMMILGTISWTDPAPKSYYGCQRFKAPMTGKSCDPVCTMVETAVCSDYWGVLDPAADAMCDERCGTDYITGSFFYCSCPPAPTPSPTTSPTSLPTSLPTASPTTSPLMGAPTPAASPAFSIVGLGVVEGDASSGTLVRDTQCITDGIGNYSSNEYVTITALRMGTLVSKGFFVGESLAPTSAPTSAPLTNFHDSAALVSGADFITLELIVAVSAVLCAIAASGIAAASSIIACVALCKLSALRVEHKHFDGAAAAHAEQRSAAVDIVGTTSNPLAKKKDEEDDVKRSEKGFREGSDVERSEKDRSRSTAAVTVAAEEQVEASSGAAEAENAGVKVLTDAATAPVAAPPPSTGSGKTRRHSSSSSSHHSHHSSKHHSHHSSHHHHGHSSSSSSSHHGHEDDERRKKEAAAKEAAAAREAATKEDDDDDDDDDDDNDDDDDDYSLTLDSD